MNNRRDREDGLVRMLVGVCVLCGAIAYAILIWG